ncbi:MAG: hypothetical protein EF806_01790 [Candidatus Methanoliparum thermophilum]|uniref:Succinyl-CoA synthetase-like flavodoxin domain-containing protein n=1 Tax=Methanoliparum thermophilum TaxID=2491083 RepID=A0A520KSA9_METT2|nr:hypothetical protein [Candidatus Methanoliparum sp. LAM-1]RZN64807.1 MAG: hypothetical protein EF806_01790 [Candidatus Methanoliparum thermophilum]BDC36324.1 hypothetical protein MTLP_10060 [Candidatus Methanoliparum sp. LAM-1]
MGFSKIVSYGNGCDLNELDFLEYLAEDPKFEKQVDEENKLFRCFYLCFPFDR